MNKEEQYIYLAKLFGACLDMVQGTGGNISIKNGDTILVKTSGVALSNTRVGNGYVMCDLSAVRVKYSEKNQDLRSTVLHGVGKPSMETFFHLLPGNYIVHLHPTSMMNLLCQSDLKTLSSYFPDALCIPYVEPGLQLAEILHSVYQHQRLIFLQNHGVIFLADTFDDLFHLIISTFQCIQSLCPTVRISDIAYLHKQYQKNPQQYMKPSFLIPGPCRVPRLRSLTPDLHLFLVSNVESSVKEHSGYYYIVGPSKDHVENIEQLLASYFLSHFDQGCVEIPFEKTISLEQNPLEQARMALSKHNSIA